MRQVSLLLGEFTIAAKKVWTVLELILLIVLILLLIGAVPTWPYSRSWGYYPSGGLGLVLIIVLLLYLFKRL